jgi:excisionase family DNA binding protein
VSRKGRKDGSPTDPCPPEDLVWTVQDVAKYLKLSRDWVYRHAQIGELPAKKVGSQLRFLSSEVKEWLRAKSIPKKKGDGGDDDSSDD